MRSRYVALGWLVALGACHRPAPQPGGRLESHWTGADTAQFAAAATAEWCAAGKSVEIQALRGDTGVVVAVFPSDTAWAGTYRLIPAPADSSRPTALVVWRWADPAAIDGVRSDSGTVTLRRGPDGALGGDIRATGWIFGGTRRRVSLSGSFHDVAVRPAQQGCPALLDHARDSSVDSSHGNDVFPEGIRPQGRGGRPSQ